MRTDVDYFKIESNHIAPRKGRILLSEPFLNDMYFKRALIFITEHNDEGTVGFVINKPVDTKMEDILPDANLGAFPLSLGGPVSTNTLHFIHTLGEKLPNAIKVYDNIYWGGDFNVMKQFVEAGVANTSNVRFFLGYSGWTLKQLDQELEQNSWLVTNLNSSLIMDSETDMGLWKTTLEKMGSRYKMWINSPENPGMN